jgi:peroxiredoxin
MSDQDDIPLDETSGVEERPQNRREWQGVLRSLVLPALVVATIVGVLVFVERTRGDGGDTTSGYGIVDLPEGLNASGRGVSSDIGRVAPDFLLETPDGGEVRLSDLRGKPVLVNFWASWCTPCRQEMPEIVRAYNERRGDGLVVVAVDLQENDAEVRAFASEFGMKFPIGVDRNGQVADAWRIGGPVQGIPSSYFLDRDGVVRERAFGPMTPASLADKLETILE